MILTHSIVTDLLIVIEIVIYIVISVLLAGFFCVYMSVCVSCNTSSSTQSCPCSNCVSDILPFNHISDDEEFYLTIHNYFHVSKEIDIGKIQSLKINPFTINAINCQTIANDETCQAHAETDCQYMFNEDFNKKYSKAHSNFSLLHVNARSLPKNYDHFCTLLDSLEFNFSIIAVSETWFKSNTNVNIYNVKDYSFVHMCRPDRIGGGVGLYVRNGFHYKLRNDLSCITSNSEMVFIELTQNNKSIIVACVYRPPNSDIFHFNSSLREILEKLESEQKELYLMGDFNIDLLHSSSHGRTCEFLDMLNSFNIYPIISKPTRISAHRASLIDNIFTNAIEKKTRNGIIYDDLSDHFPIFSIHNNDVIPIHRTQREKVQKRVINETNILLFKKKLKDIDWSCLQENDDINTSYDTFFDKFNCVYNQCFPLKTVDKKAIRCRRPWITKGILKSINRKNRLYKASLRNPDVKHKTAYKSYKNKLTNTIRFSKYKYYSDMFISLQGDMKKTWSNINEILGRKKYNAMPNNMFFENRKFTSKQDIVNQFNSYFINVGSNLAKSISSSSFSFKQFMSCQETESFFIKPTSVYEILKLSSSIKISKADGPDGISPRVIKECIHYIVNPLCDIFNMSLCTGIVPDKLKIAKIVPLFKKDNPAHFENYRPVALLSIFAKLLERLMYNRLYDFLTKQNILIHEQFGFRKNYSTSLSVICFTDYILQEIDKGNFCCGVFMDLSKAFDTIDHHILLEKLYLYGIRGVSLQWFNSYLSDRKQYVVVDGVESSHLDVNLGVPQGSVLGPLLFLIYVNDIINCSSIMKFSLFADDTVVLQSHKNIIDLMSIVNNELKMLNDWFKCNKLFLNFKKTKYVMFHSKRKKLPLNINPIKIEDTVIDRTESINFLGVLIHESLDWKYHISNISSKISRSVGVLSKIKSYLPRNVLRTIYNAIVLPHLNYCNEIWGKTYKVHIDKLYILQKRAMRHITKSDSRSSSLPLFIKLKCLPIFHLVRLNILVFMFKYQKGILPALFQNMFNTNSSFHDYQTRLRDNLRTPIIHSTIRTHSIRFTGVHEWNSVSNDIKSSSTLTRFRTLFKRLTFENLSSMIE